MRIGPPDDLAFKLKDQAQDAVRGGMLRAKIDSERALVVSGDNLGHDFSAIGAQPERETVESGP
jgi:hypothetical protein